MTTRTILVTGAGGFIGARVVEVLHGLGIGTVRAAVRRWASAARIGRLPVDIHLCDLRIPQQVDRAVQGVDAIVHCAHGGRPVNVEGTALLLESALRHGVRRVVHLSTVAVYGVRQGTLDESAPTRYTGDEYGDTKLDGERACQDAARRGCPVVILRPTLVYGPFSQSWTVEFIERMRSGTWYVPDELARGRCNLVYVDDLVQAVLRCLRKPLEPGEVFNVNGGDAVTWAEYFRALHAALGLPSLRYRGRGAARLAAAGSVPLRATARLVLRHAQTPLRFAYRRSRVARHLLDRAEHLLRRTPSPREFELYGANVEYPTDKARAVLGYRPAFSLSEGLRLTAAWARHHRLA
jgi:nucleoside-diphosphate-sugar epimerase